MDASSAAAADFALTARAAETSEARLWRSFEHCAASLYRYFRVRVADTHLCDDFMQQLWLHAQRGATSVPPEKIEHWLRVTAKNLLRSHWRRRARRPLDAAMPDPRLAAQLADRLVGESLPTSELERREVSDQLLLAITELPADEQDLIVGYYFEALPQAALAERLGTSERAIEGRLYRARAALRDRLKRLVD
jgi:RNA polymerase sigma factor (sigma-70 family)